ncbi:MAG TPA: hypothetical protein VI957_01685 [Candidatus Paceibacterota bacterium]
MIEEIKPSLPPFDECFASTRPNTTKKKKAPYASNETEPVIEVTPEGDLVVEGHVVVPNRPPISGDILGD